VLTGPGKWLNRVAVAAVDGQPVAVTTSSDNTLRMWDLADGSERAVFTGHTNWANGVAVAVVEGQPVAITTGGDNTIWMWNLVNHSLRIVLTALQPADFSDLRISSHRKAQLTDCRKCS
jgi:WD40 repeat protein